MCCRLTDAVVRRIDMSVGNNDTRGMGRPKLTIEAIVNDTTHMI